MDGLAKKFLDIENWLQKHPTALVASTIGINVLEYALFTRRIKRPWLKGYLIMCHASSISAAIYRAGTNHTLNCLGNDSPEAAIDDFSIEE